MQDRRCRRENYYLMKISKFHGKKTSSRNKNTFSSVLIGKSSRKDTRKKWPKVLFRNARRTSRDWTTIKSWTECASKLSPNGRDRTYVACGQTTTVFDHTEEARLFLQAKLPKMDIFVKKYVHGVIHECTKQRKLSEFKPSIHTPCCYLFHICQNQRIGVDESIGKSVGDCVACFHSLSQELSLSLLELLKKNYLQTELWLRYQKPLQNQMQRAFAQFINDENLGKQDSLRQSQEDVNGLCIPSSSKNEKKTQALLEIRPARAQKRPRTRTTPRAHTNTSIYFMFPSPFSQFATEPVASSY